MFKLLTSIPHDKLLHFIAGIILFMIITVFKIDAFTALIGVAVVGIAKELIYDTWIKKGIPDVIDFLATVLGGLVVFGYELIKLI